MLVARQRDILPPDPTWTAFEQRHAGQSFLQQDPLYAMSKEVIDAIKAEVPGFFTADQEEFERDLARSTRHGFFLRSPIGSDRVGFGPCEAVQESALVSRPEFAGITVDEVMGRQELQEVMGRLARVSSGEGGQSSERMLEQAIREIILTVQTSMTSPRRNQMQDRTILRQQTLLQRRQEGYVGWLTLNSTYREEVTTLQQNCGRWVQEQGQFPCTGEEADPSGTLSSHDHECTQQFLCFYRRWGLDRLLTWELPLPMNVVRCEVSELAGQAPPFEGWPC